MEHLIVRLGKQISEPLPFGPTEGLARLSSVFTIWSTLYAEVPPLESMTDNVFL